MDMVKDQGRAAMRYSFTMISLSETDMLTLLVTYLKEAFFVNG